MVIINLVNDSDYENSCGFLICENEEITSCLIQKKINEIKSKMDQDGIDWIIDDIISEIPGEWMVKLYDNRNIVRI